MGKHAYLLMVHESTKTLSTLLECLDDERNDIFIHVDKKSKGFDFAQCESVVKRSRVIWAPRIRVAWGGYSQIKAEMLLLQTATRCGSYTYYHLLSGADLPLKTQDEIHEYFEKHQDEEFVRFQDGEFQFGDRVRYYHFFREILPRRTRSLWAVCLRVMDITSLMVQKAFGVNRNKGIKFQKGANWFSITDKFARYVIGQKEWIEKTFRWTTCCDEVFLQTLLVNSDFKDNCHVKEKDNSCESIKRFIDWERGTPYTFTSEDYDTLIHSNMLFARKFSDEEIEVVDMIKRFILHI